MRPPPRIDFKGLNDYADKSWLRSHPWYTQPEVVSIAAVFIGALLVLLLT